MIVVNSFVYNVLTESVPECHLFAMLSKISIFLSGLCVLHPPVGLTAWWVNFVLPVYLMAWGICTRMIDSNILNLMCLDEKREKYLLEMSKIRNGLIDDRLKISFR